MALRRNPTDIDIEAYGRITLTRTPAGDSALVSRTARSASTTVTIRMRWCTGRSCSKLSCSERSKRSRCCSERSKRPRCCSERSRWRSKCSCRIPELETRKGPGPRCMSMMTIISSTDLGIGVPATWLADHMASVVCLKYVSLHDMSKPIADT
jgi:hypothetical protein